MEFLKYIMKLGTQRDSLGAKITGHYMPIKCYYLSNSYKFGKALGIYIFKSVHIVYSNMSHFESGGTPALCS